MPRSSPLDTDLDHYSATARTVLDIRKPAKRLGELALYTAAAGSALALAPGADASIIYSGIRDITVSFGSAGPGTYVDLNGDGADDIQFLVQRILPSTTAAGMINRSPDSGAATVAFLLSPQGPLQKLPVSNYMSYGAGNLTVAFAFAREFNGSTSAGNFAPGPNASTSGYAGFEIVSGTSHAPHFGWMHLKLHVDGRGRVDDFTLVDWAFQSMPRVPIHVADRSNPPPPVPEPSGLAMLGLGAIGIAALRRKRGKKANRADGIS